MRSALIAALVLIATAASAAPSEQATPAGETELRAAWAAFAAPALGPAETRTLEGRQQARLAALEQMEAAVAANPGSPVYQAALAYICLSAGKYGRAKEAVDCAIGLRRNDPLLYLLRGQAEAALAEMAPAEAGERIGPALRAFGDAARLAPANSLALLQGASVAFDVSRSDLALPMVKQALERQDFVLYPLSVPGDIGADRTASLRMWQHVQLGQWLELLARCDNVSRALMRLGEEKMQAQDLEGAEAHFRDALEVGRRVGSAKPSLFITTNMAINLMENAYSRLLQVAETTGSKDAERWRGELGVLQIGRGELYGALQKYTKRLDEDPPASIQELLDFEAACVEETVLGIGLTPAGDRREPPQSGVPSGSSTSSGAPASHAATETAPQTGPAQ